MPVRTGPTWAVRTPGLAGGYSPSQTEEDCEESLDSKEPVPRDVAVVTPRYVPTVSGPIWGMALCLSAGGRRWAEEPGTNLSRPWSSGVHASLFRVRGWKHSGERISGATA